MRRQKYQQNYQQQKNFNRQAKTPDPRNTNSEQKEGGTPNVGRQEQSIDPSKLFQIPCKFWKTGKCDWGWSCRFLHGAEFEHDPRRPEYRSQPIDFTQFPKPFSASSPHLSQQQSVSAALNTIRAEDQTRFTVHRKPVVEIFPSASSVSGQMQNFKDMLLRNSINVLASDSTRFYTLNKIKEQFEHDDTRSDYVLYIDISGLYLLLPDHSEPLSCTSSNICMVILNDWNTRNNNFSLEQLELLSSTELEQILVKLTPDVLDNIEENMQALQNETTDAIQSMTTNNCKFTKVDIQALRTKILAFFGKLNLANFMIADLPIYMNREPEPGVIVQSRLPKPVGLSHSTQKVLLYIIGCALSQLHVCLSHLNKALGEYVPMKSSYSQVLPTSPCLHQSPLCSANCEDICKLPEVSLDKLNKLNFDLKRNLEPEVAVDMPTQYSLSFRNRKFGDGDAPFGQQFTYGYY